MGAPTWDVPVELSEREALMVRELKRTGKLFGFLRRYRHAIIGPEVEAELCAMYRSSDAGKTPLPPAMMVFVLIMQAYAGVSDAEAVERARYDARWQLVLGTLESAERVFSQGALFAFRERLIAHDMDRRLLERTAEFARSSAAFDSKKLPKSLRLAVDSRPLAGAGRVEDTVNLLGRAGRQLLICAAALAKVTPDQLAKRLKAHVFVAPSIKAGLDIDWTDTDEREGAMQRLLSAIDALESWVRKRFAADIDEPPLSEHLQMIAKLREQNIDPDPPDGGPSIRDGVAPNRIISLGDAEMRHGRKSKSKTINGYKSHVATELEHNLVLACTILPANVREHEGFDAMRTDLERVIDLTKVTELHVDRGYAGANLTHELVERGARLVSKPRSHGGVPGLFNKHDFRIDLRTKMVTCPGGQTLRFVLGKQAQFNREICNSCPLQNQCTTSRKGRRICVPEDEAQQRKLLALAKSRPGRTLLRERVAVEHTLARQAAVQGIKARYVGTRANVFDSRRSGSVINVETAARLLAA